MPRNIEIKACMAGVDDLSPEPQPSPTKAPSTSPRDDTSAL